MKKTFVMLLTVFMMAAMSVTAFSSPGNPNVLARDGSCYILEGSRYLKRGATPLRVLDAKKCDRVCPMNIDIVN